MIGIPLGLLVANAGEWLIHKHILHGLGRDRKSFWSFHWHDHHAKARKSEMLDDQYTSPLWQPWEPQTKEAVALAGLALAHAPLFPLMPFYVGTIWYSALKYYQVHKKAHLDVEWCKEHLPWHYDHHMGRDQNANWCVTHPLFDELLGTRKRYAYGAGVPQELASIQAAPARVREAVRSAVARQLGTEPERIPAPAPTRAPGLAA